MRGAASTSLEGSRREGRDRWLHPLQRGRRYALPWRMWLALSSLLRAEDATQLAGASGVDGDAWYATDYVYPNHWPYNEQPAVPLPLAKRRSAVREYLRTFFDTELIVGVVMLVLVYVFYLYLTAPAPEGPPEQEWVYYTPSE